MRVLLADNLPDAARLRLMGAGFTVHADPSLSGDALRDALAEHAPDVLVVRSTKVTAAQLEATSALQLVVRAGAGVNTIDLDAASALGIFVSNCPGMNAVAVAELTFGHILNADRRIAEQVADMRAGQWRKKAYGKLQGRGLKGRTLGVLGCGNIGRAVVARALAFEMEVIAWSPSLCATKARHLGVTRAADPVEVARAADVLSVHLALTPTTRGLVGPAIFDALPNGAIVVNTSRGEVLDEAALANAVATKGIRAGLDVFVNEPKADGPFAAGIVRSDGVYGTHHTAASTIQSQEAVADEACRIVETWGTTGEAINCVNLADQTPATHQLVIRHADQVGVLAGVLAGLREDGINVQQMENMIFSGANGAACARIQIEGTPSDAALDALRADDRIFDIKRLAL